MSKKRDITLTNNLKDLFDIEVAFARIEALSNALLSYTVTNDQDEMTKQDTIDFTLMTIHDYAKFYGDQVQNLQIIDGKLQPINAAE